jgi:hypothetical protein
MKIYKIANKTVLSKFKQNRFFDDMLLTTKEFLLEQRYLRKKLKLHNRLHGNGVVWGLNLKSGFLKKNQSSCVQSKEQTAFVDIMPGYAIDYLGNDVIVCSPWRIYLQEVICEILSTCLINNNYDEEHKRDLAIKLYIGLLYDECYAEPTEQYVTACDDETDLEYSEVKKVFKTVIFRHESEPVHSSVHYGDKKYCHDKQYEPECEGIKSKCLQGKIIILGSIRIKRQCKEDSIFNITEDKIDNSDGRIYAWIAPGISHQWMTPGLVHQWEDARNTLLHVYRNHHKFHDVTIVLGKQIDEARTTLKEQFSMIVNPKVLTIEDIDHTIFTLIRTACPIQPQKSRVTLITDNQKEKVLFIIPG